MTTDRVVRDVARVVLLDPDDRVLLLHGFDPADSLAGRWWFTPGGGVEEGESFEGAAIREVEEETGLQLPAVVALPGERTTEFEFDGRSWEQRERYFAARAQLFTVDDAGWTEVERRSLLGARWWSVTELRDTSERYFPESLVDIVGAAIGVLR